MSLFRSARSVEVEKVSHELRGQAAEVSQSIAEKRQRTQSATRVSARLESRIRDINVLAEDVLKHRG